MKKRNSFKNYLRRSLVRYAVGLILATFVLFALFMSLNLRLTTVRVNATANRELAEYMNQRQWEMKHMSSFLVSQPQLLQALQNRTMKTVTDANSLLYENINAFAIRCIFVLQDGKGEIVATNLNKGNQALFLQNRQVEAAQQWLLAHPHELYESYSHIAYAYDQDTDWMFANSVYDEAEQRLGTLFLDMTQSGLREKLNNQQVDMTVIADRFDNVIYADNQQTTDRMGKLPVPLRQGGFVNLGGKAYFATVRNVGEDGVRILTFSSVVLHRQMLWYGAVLIGLIAVILLLWVPLLAGKVSKRNLRPIEKMIQTIKSADLNGYIDEKTFDEFQPLYNEFNDMMKRMRELIEHNTELAERKRVMEVKHLKEQFNPHFVFNLMENLRYEIASDPAKAADMVVAFSSLMRYEIDEVVTRVPLGTDMEYLNDYLLLQKIRYGKRLDYHIEIEEALLECMVPKLLIQPIVENSIKYGANRTTGIELLISARQEGSYLHIRIDDDGVGMNARQLASIQQMLADENAVTTHIGLYNTHRALQLMFGAPCGLKIHSEQSKGTRVELTIPWEEAHV
ncbi:MAG: histidine kinase [Clostridia bacterium]